MKTPSPCCNAKIVEITADDYWCSKCGRGVDYHDELLSECCGALPIGEIHNGFAHCSDCKEMAAFSHFPADTMQERALGTTETLVPASIKSRSIQILGRSLGDSQHSRKAGVDYLAHPLVPQGMEQHETPVFELGKDETGGPAFFWRNPWSNGKREKIASLWWPEHPESATEKVEWLFDNLELRVKATTSPNHP